MLREEGLTNVEVIKTSGKKASPSWDFNISSFVYFLCDSNENIYEIPVLLFFALFSF